jgi:hypothetical protein
MRLLRSNIVIVAVLGFTVSAFAQGKAEHDHGEEAKHYKVTPPADIKAAWTLVTTKVAEAEKHLADKKTEPVHEIGEQLEVAVHVLQEKSDMVADNAKARLASALTQLDKAIDGMHHAAEDKDAAQAALELGKIKGLLPLVEAQYPAAALK